jgi:hypothetical protein
LVVSVGKTKAGKDYRDAGESCQLNSVREGLSGKVTLESTPEREADPNPEHMVMVEKAFQVGGGVGVTALG